MTNKIQRVVAPTEEKKQSFQKWSYKTLFSSSMISWNNWYYIEYIIYSKLQCPPTRKHKTNVIEQKILNTSCSLISETYWTVTY